MARLAHPLAVFFSLLFLFTLSRASDFQNPFPEPKPHSEPASLHPEPKTEPHDTVSFTIDSVDPVPLTLLHFRPINRHFHPDGPLPSQLPLSLRTRHRRCRHGHRREIPYGNDAIVLSDAGADRRVWTRFQRATKPQFPVTEERFDSDREHHHGGEHHHHHHHHEDWFAKKIRKFLNLF